MTLRIKKYLNKIKEGKYLLIILGIFGIFFIFFIDKLRISPDEYFYVSLGRSMAAAYVGEGCLYCIDTAHTPLFPFLISIGYYFFNIDSIFVYRFISIIFVILTLYALFKIYEIVFTSKKDAFWFFAIILMFPGFFTFAGKVNLGILAMFFSSVVIYLLLKREAYWKISLALFLVFLSKDYFVLFCGPVVLFMIIVDVLKAEGIDFRTRARKIITDLLIVFLPLLFLVVFFVTFPIFPYSRMLDGMFLEVFGHWYVSLGQEIRYLFDLSQINAYIPNVAENIKDSAGVVTQSSLGGSLSFASFFQKIGAIYKSSYKELDVSPLVIPLVIVGFALRTKNLYMFFRHKYDAVRNDLILILFVIVFFYFNYRIASGNHGFRIIFPLLIPYIYFIYRALESLLDGKKYWAKFSFAILSFLSIFMYFESNREDIVRNGFITVNYFIALFFKYKVFINIMLYASIALFILVYSKLRIKRKPLLFIVILTAMFIYKTTPFAIEKYLIDREHGKDFDLILARPYLEEIEKNKSIILTNINSYKYYYYANSTKMPNVARRDLPIIRKSPEIINPNSVIVRDLQANDLEIKFLCKSKADYVFYLKKNIIEVAPTDLIHDYPYLTPLTEHSTPKTGRLNWGLYKIDKSSCGK